MFTSIFTAAVPVLAEGMSVVAIATAETAAALHTAVVGLSGVGGAARQIQDQAELRNAVNKSAAKQNMRDATPQGNQTLSRNIPSGDNVAGKEQESRWNSNWWCWVCNSDAAQFPRGSADPRRGSGQPFTQKAKDSVRTGTCAGCGDQTTRPSDPNQSNIGHNIPRARGGDSSALNAIELCRDCNQDMFILIPEEHARRLELTGRLRTTPQDPVRQQRIEDKRKKWLWRWGGGDE